MQDYTTIRQKAKEQLLVGGNLVRLAMATVTGIVALMIPILLGSGILNLMMLNEFTMLFAVILVLPMYLLIIAFLIFFTLPVWHAGFRLAYALQRGERESIWSALRSVFGKGYGSVLLWSIFSLLRICLFAAVGIGGVLLAIESVVASVAGIFGMLFYLALTVMVLAGLMLVLRRSYYVQAGLCCGMKWKEANRLSKERMRAQGLQVWRYSLQFLPELLLVFPTIGASFVVYTMPRIFMSYAYVTEEIHSERINQEQKGMNENE